MRRRVEFAGLDHVQLAAPAGSEKRARDFFAVVLGLEEIPKPPKLQRRGGVWFRVGSQELHVGVEDSSEFHPNKRAHPAFEVKNIKELRRILVSRGVKVQDDESVGHADRFYTEDPFGNRLEFLQLKSRKLRR